LNFLRQAIALEETLGCPLSSDALLSQAGALAADERERFDPDVFCALHALGLSAQYVPAEYGGRFERFDSFFSIGRVLARRDLAFTISYSTQIWSVLVWMAGSERQKSQMAAELLTMKFPCLAYSEAEHGADLLSNQTLLTEDGDGRWRLRGEKWPINRGTESDIALVLARHVEALNWRGQSLFLLRKNDLPAGTYEDLPREATHGLRACDISGIRFIDTPVTSAELLGQTGEGLEWALKGLQVTRTCCTPLALGALDSLLRLTLQFLHTRQLYQHSILRHDVVALQVVDIWSAAIRAELVSVVAARALHLFPQQFSSWSLVAKTFVSDVLDDSAEKLKRLLGARFYLRRLPFQKILRDSEVVSLFDGSSAVCLDALAVQLPQIMRVSGTAGSYRLSKQRAQRLFDLGADLPVLNWDGFEINGRGCDAVLGAWPVLKQMLGEIKNELFASGILQSIDERMIALESGLAAQGDRPAGRKRQPIDIHHAKLYNALHADIVSIGTWLFNRERCGVFFAAAEWLVHGIEDHWKAQCSIDAKRLQSLLTHIVEQQTSGKMFSLFDWPLAGKAR
jgi:alkylation response protein AidB-like acyl-CoA dehydrogenase